MRKIIVLLLIALVVSLTAIYFLADFSVLKPINERRSNILDDIKIIDSFENKEGLIVLSSGRTRAENEFYSLDLVDKNLFGYKWVGGIGHINKDLMLVESDEVFQMSLQVSNEEQSGTPYILGIVNDQSIKSIKVQINNKKYHSKMIKSDTEMLYIIELESLENSHYMIVYIEYINGTKEEFLIGDEIETVISGVKIIYHYK